MTSSNCEASWLSPRSWANSTSTTSCGRGRLPTWVVRIRSILSLIIPGQDSTFDLSCKIEIPALWIGAHQLHLKLIAYIHTLLSTHQDSFGGRARYTHEYTLGRHACHDGGKSLADSMLERHRRNALIHHSFHFARRIFLKSAVLSN